ncbi:hypothetical protein LINGRAHAP2_LOCUS5032, partial [Linum grandiflorum]
ENKIEGYSKSRIEAIRLSDGEKAVYSCVIPLNISDLLAQRLKDAADTLAQASKAIPESLKMGNNQNHEGSVLKDAISEAAQKTTKTRTRKRPGLTRKEHGSKKQMTEERKVEAASLEWLPNDK